jgi:putative DNA primase/helicase
MLMCEIASILSRGGEWPDNSGKAQKMQCAILSAEDNAEESLVPRLLAAGASLEDIFILQATIKEKTKERGKPKTLSRVFNIGADLKKLTGLVKKHPEMKVLFIDPIGAFIGTGKQTDSYKSAEVRAILTPITEWASRRGICVIYISHANKNGTGRALNRMTDSQAFGAAPRFVWIVGPNPLNPEGGSKIFASAKVNIAKEVSSLEFRIDDAEIRIQGKKTTRGRVHWIGESNATADQVVSPEPQKRPSAVEAAQTFLRDILENAGPTRQVVIREKAEGIHSWRTIERAKHLLGIISKKAPGSSTGDWIWRMPEDFEELESDEL